MNRGRPRSVQESAAVAVAAETALREELARRPGSRAPLHGASHSHVATRGPGTDGTVVIA
jgi:hypothetical protein